MIRIAIDIAGGPGRTAPLDPDLQHYLFTGMRRHPGDVVEVLVPEGPVWTARLIDARTGRMGGLVDQGLPPRSLTLYQALLKGDRFSEVVDRATQAGVTRIVPIVTERTIVRSVSPNKMARWRHIAKEASEQSRRLQVPELSDVVPLAGITAGADAQAYALDPRGSREQPWRDPSPALVEVAVGPEGGFSPSEIEELASAGFAPLSLGAAVYRAENAGAFACVLFLQ